MLTASVHAGAGNFSDARLSAEDIEKRDIAWLDQATHLIAEVTAPSIGTGREIEYARARKIKILCVYKKEQEFFTSPMIRGMTQDRYPNVKVRSYESEDELRLIIKSFLSIK